MYIIDIPTDFLHLNDFIDVSVSRNGFPQQIYFETQNFDNEN